MGGLRDFTLWLLRWELFSSQICPPSGAAQESGWSRAPSESSLFLVRTRPQGMSVCACVHWGRGWGMATGQPVPGPSSCGLILPCCLLGRPPCAPVRQPQAPGFPHMGSAQSGRHRTGPNTSHGAAEHSGRAQAPVPGWLVFKSQHLLPSCVTLAKLFNLSVPLTSGICSSL